MLIRNCCVATLEDVSPEGGCSGVASFVAVDVETANVRPASICQIGVVAFSNGKVADVWQSLVDREEPFTRLHVGLHGIDATRLCQAPPFPKIVPILSSLLSGRVVISHMAVDRIALRCACLKYGLPPVQCTWLDSARVARRVWPRFAKRGYGLKSLASWCGFDFLHHNAVEDASAAGHVFMRALAESRTTVEEWVFRFGMSNAVRDVRQ